MTGTDALLAKALADHRGGRPDLAEPVYRRLVEDDPAHAEARHLLAVVCLQTGRAAEAEIWARQATRLDPAHAKAFNTLGNALAALGRRDEALDAFEAASAADPSLADAALNLGITLAGLGRPEESVAALRRAAQLAPADARPLVSAAAPLIALERPAEAEEAARAALALAPGHPGAATNLGLALARLGRPEEAVSAFALAEKSGGRTAGLYAAWGHALKATGELAGAIERFRQAIALDPADANPQHALLTSLSFHDSVTAETVMEAFRDFGRRHEPALAARRKPFLVDADPDRMLRIAYLAPNLGDHVLSQNIAPVLRHHHRDRVRVCVYAHVPKPDKTTWRMKESADEWNFVHGMDDEALAERIRADRIDVLVHPMGHWADSRLLAVARKPAPVIVNYLNNSPSSGLAACDATIIDEWLDFDGRVSALSIEEPIRLKSGFQVTEYQTAPVIGPPPCLANGFVTFGSFNNPMKLSGACLDLWAEVLRAVPGSRLLLKGGGLGMKAWRERLHAAFAKRGVAPDRLDLMDRLPGWRGHLELYDRIDIQLDTLPFTGGRTSEDALWMGVPVVTLIGEGVWGRYTWGHLCRIGRTELAARTPGAFVAVATLLAADSGRLGEYRRTLRDAMRNSTIMDYNRHCAELEDCFRMLWRRRCRGGTA